MNKLKLVTLLVVISVLTMPSSYSQKAGVVKENWDNLPLIELRKRSLGDIEQHRSVLEYFKARLYLLNNLSCPRLTQEWIDTHADQDILVGTPSFFGANRMPESQILKQMLVLDIDGVKWGVNLKVDGLNTARFQKDSFGGVSELKLVTNKVSKYPIDGAYGTIITKTCGYNSPEKNLSTIELSVFDEILPMPELELGKY